MLQTLSALITIINFLYAILALPGLNNLGLPFEVHLLPSVAFFLFFLLEVVCSYFICHAVVYLSDRQPNFLRSYSLLFGIMNAGTSLFNYQFLFSKSNIDTSFDAIVFGAFIFGAFIVDWIVINDLQMNRSNTRTIFSPYASVNRMYASREANEFIRIQFVIYFLACLYILGVTRSL